MFNDQYLHYEDEIVKWSGFDKIGSVPAAKAITRDFILTQAEKIRPSLLKALEINV